jgi:two-component system, OmpR family, catabolic regulation response regulator CreB
MPRLLLVEDEPAIADTLVYVLENECHLVSHAMTGMDALAMQSAASHDLAILDVGLPDMTGFDLDPKSANDYETRWSEKFPNGAHLPGC